MGTGSEQMFINIFTEVFIMNKRTMYTGCFVLLLAFAIFSAIKLTNVEAMGGERVATKKSYISYEIQSGDTLISIAKENIKDTNISVDEYIDEVKTNNQMYSDKIRTGNKIIIAKYEF